MALARLWQEPSEAIRLDLQKSVAPAAVERGLEPAADCPAHLTLPPRRCAQGMQAGVHGTDVAPDPKELTTKWERGPGQKSRIEEEVGGWGQTVSTEAPVPAQGGAGPRLPRQMETQVGSALGPAQERGLYSLGTGGPGAFEESCSNQSSWVHGATFNGRHICSHLLFRGGTTVRCLSGVGVPRP